MEPGAGARAKDEEHLCRAIAATPTLLLRETGPDGYLFFELPHHSQKHSFIDCEEDGTGP
ncbi:MAG: hypothetical protein ACPGUV_04595 [Polyangiales bacterium]